MLRKLFGTVKAWIIWILIVIVIIAVYFLFANHITPSTNDAYLHAYTIPVAPQVPGRITAIYVKNNQPVTKGEALYQVDQRPYVHAVNYAAAQLIETKDKIKELETEIDQAQGLIKDRTANLKLAQEQYNEKRKLAERGYLSTSAFQTATKTLTDAKQQLYIAEQKLSQAKRNLGSTIDGVNVHLRKAQAQLALAKLKLTESTVKAPDNGYITNLYMNIGNYAKIGEAQMALVANDKWFVYANIKENNLRNIATGNKALVTINMLPGKIFHGTVTSIGKGVNLADDIPQNYLPKIKKTHDWVRLAQRFPVQITLNTNTSQKINLRTGASAGVAIMTGTSHFWNGLAYFYLWLRSQFQYFS